MCQQVPKSVQLPTEQFDESHTLIAPVPIGMTIKGVCESQRRVVDDDEVDVQHIAHRQQSITSRFGDDEVMPITKVRAVLRVSEQQDIHCLGGASG